MTPPLPKSHKDLLVLRAAVDAALEAHEARRRRTAAKLKSLAIAEGFTLEELLGETMPAAPAQPPTPEPRKRPKRTRKARGNGRHAMRDAETGVIWAGRGRLPGNFDRARAVPVQ